MSPDDADVWLACRRRRRYAYLPIAPRAGELWAFPGYVPHAVLPRVLAPDAPEREDLRRWSDPSRLRVSVACNAVLKERQPPRAQPPRAQPPLGPDPPQSQPPAASA